MTTLGIISDLHLDFRHSSFLDIPLPSTQILVLCGDIAQSNWSNYFSFLEYCDKKYQHLFLVAGNHEYYQSTRPSTDNLIKSWCQKLSHLHYLQRQSFVYQNYMIIGATLWSNLSINLSDDIEDSLNDYNNISYQFYNSQNQKEKRYINTIDTIEWYQKDVSWIRYQIFKAQQRHLQCLIFTHHSPISFPYLNHLGKNKYLDSAYNNHLDYLLGGCVKLWGFGHTHNPFYEIRNETLLVNNPWGYPKEIPYHHPESLIINL